MFRGRKTTTFYVGLVALGWAIYFLISLFDTISYTLLNAGSRFYLSLSPLFLGISSVVIFFVIGLYTMSKGVEKEPEQAPLAS